MRPRHLVVVVSALFMTIFSAGCATGAKFQPDADPVSYLFGTWETVGMMAGSNDRFSGHREFVIPPQAVLRAPGEQNGTVTGWYGIPGKRLRQTEFTVEYVDGSVAIRFLTNSQSTVILFLVGPDWLDGRMRFAGEGREIRVTYQKKGAR